MGYLGKLTKTGAVDPTNPVFAGGWTITFDPGALGIKQACEVYHIAVKGPPATTFEVWVDDTFYDNVARGDINSWDPSQPLFIQPGATIYFYYNAASGTAPKASLFFREPPIL